MLISRAARCRESGITFGLTIQFTIEKTISRNLKMISMIKN